MKVKNYVIGAMAVFAFAACSQDEVNDDPVEVRISASIDAMTTRAVNDQWSKDTIGVRVTASTSTMKDLYKNVEYRTTESGTSATFTPASDAITFQSETGEVTFAAYAPYQASADNALPGTDGVITVNTKDYNTDADQRKIDFLYASGAKASKSSPTVVFANISGGTDCSFKHVMSRLVLVLKVDASASLGADKIFDATDVKLSGLKHSGTFNVTTGATATTGSTTTDWIITGCKKTDSSPTRTYSLILLPQDASSGLPFSLTIDGQTYSTTTTGIAPNLEAGKSYTYTITVTTGSETGGLTIEGSTITDWDSAGGGSVDATK